MATPKRPAAKPGKSWTIPGARRINIVDTQTFFGVSNFSEEPAVNPIILQNVDVFESPWQAAL